MRQGQIGQRKLRGDALLGGFGGNAGERVAAAQGRGFGQQLAQLAARDYDAGLAQVREVPRDLGLALAEDFDEVADADFAARHEVEQAQARRVGQAAKRRGRSKGGLGGATRHVHCIRLDKYDMALIYLLRRM
jgi:hypothetical protein